MPIKTEATEATSTAPSITSRQAQEALSNLLLSEESSRAYWKQRDVHECSLDDHPFGLETEMLLPIEGSPVICNQVFLIAWPGYADTSVAAMKLMLQHTLIPGRSWGDYVHFRLRIVRVEQGEKRHDLYFELITRVGTFICGGCNDYSGEGGSGGRDLESIFTFIAALYEIRLEEIVIPQAEGEAGKRKLKDAYNAFKRRRAQSTT